MNLYSHKQRWKIALLLIALLTVGASLFISNNIVGKVGQRERERARQWAAAIKKKIALVQLTNRTFTQLRDRELEKMTLWIEATKEVSKDTPLNQDFEKDFPRKIIDRNTDIPVILLDDQHNYSGSINLGFNEDSLIKQYPELNRKEVVKMFEDSAVSLANKWQKKHKSFSIEVYPGFYMSYFYNDSKEIVRLEHERDSLINAFNNDLINNEGLVPVLLIDAETKEIIGTNIDEYEINPKNLDAVIAELSGQNQPIIVDYNNGASTILYFDDSPELKQLQYFPYIQFIVIGLFALIGYLIFSTFRKAEQNKVWAGMAKETAHQLGTPLSSLIGWIQLLQEQGTDKMITTEMQKDVDRLEKVTDRFSKIGSGALLEDSNLAATVENIMEYLRPRISEKVEVVKDIDVSIRAKHNGALIEWVIENVCKNAVDAMEGEGVLTVKLFSQNNKAIIDVVDTGKGIPSKELKRIFEPGYSTKKRGWGLGLSLVKRIIQEYHGGSIMVHESKVNVGTTLRISIPVTN
jgi:signal transduction histidine kinase